MRWPPARWPRAPGWRLRPPRRGGPEPLELCRAAGRGERPLEEEAALAADVARFGDAIAAAYAGLQARGEAEAAEAFRHTFATVDRALRLATEPGCELDARALATLADPAAAAAAVRSLARCGQTDALAAFAAASACCERFAARAAAAHRLCRGRSAGASRALLLDGLRADVRGRL